MPSLLVGEAAAHAQRLQLYEPGDILVDVDNDIAITATTNFPGDKADAAMLNTIELLYKRYGPVGGGK